MDYQRCKCGHTRDMHRFAKKCIQEISYVDGRSIQCACPIFEGVTDDRQATDPLDH